MTGVTEEMLQALRELPGAPKESNCWRDEYEMRWWQCVRIDNYHTPPKVIATFNDPEKAEIFLQGLRENGDPEGDAEYCVAPLLLPIGVDRKMLFSLMGWENEGGQTT